MFFIDYCKAEECKNEETWYTCYKCEKCGRKFDEQGIMVDDGGTHPYEEGYDIERQGE